MCVFYTSLAKDGFDTFGDLVDDNKTNPRVYSLCENRELVMDARKSDSTLELRLGFNSDVNFSAPTQQKILVSPPVSLPDSFSGKTLAYWEYTGDDSSSNTHSKEGPYTEKEIYDVKYYAGAYPGGKNGVMITRTLEGSYKAGVHEKARLGLRVMADLDGSGSVDTNDYNIVVSCVGPYGGSPNVAGKERIAGRPSEDGKVDEDDLWVCTICCQRRVNLK